MIKMSQVIVLCIIVQSCSSSVKTVDGQIFKPDVVLSRIDNMGSRPDWLRESEPFKIKSNEIISLGSTTIAGDERIDAAYRIAENEAKAAISKGIEQKLSFIFQNAEEGTKVDSSQVSFIGSEISRMTTSSIKLQNRYWEKVVTYNDIGTPKTIYKVFATVSMPEGEFKQAVLNALKKREGKGGISAEFAAKVDSEWKKLVE